MQQTSKHKSKERAGVFLKAALEALNDAGGSLSWTDICKAVASKVALTEHDFETYEKSGYVRWQSVLLFYSITAHNTPLKTNLKHNF
jgi:restriction system protein